MKKPACEYVKYTILPSIRKEFSKNLIKIYGFNQKQVAEILGVTPATICQYLSNKRGGIKITNKCILNEIEISTNNIYKNGRKVASNETCRICRLITSSKKTPILKKIICEGDVSPCKKRLWKILPIIRKEFTKILIKKYNYNQKQVAH